MLVKGKPEMTQRKGSRLTKKIVVSGIVISIALIHFITGSGYKGPFPRFVNSYLLDILVPFAFYLLLCVSNVSLFKPWFVKGALVFAIGVSVEALQFFEVPLFGRTFDPVDFVMYAIGVTLAAILDTTVLPRIFEFWAPKVEGFHSEKRGIV